MSISNIANQLTEQLRNFINLQPEKFMAGEHSFNDFGGANPDEVTGHLYFIKSIYEPMLSTSMLSQLSFNIIQSLQATLNSVVTSYDQLIRTPNQGQFQQFAQSIDSFVAITYQFGIPYFSSNGAHIEGIRTALQFELDKARQNNIELESLRDAVHQLITPAVAGSLSHSFTTRRNFLMWGRFGWLFATVIFGILAAIATYSLVDHISSSFEAISKQPNSSSYGSIWPAIAIRSILLLPTFVAFGFSFSQYRKEREYEEEYAHKAAVAHSLPNYSDLAREGAVRDQIVTAATGVVFISPGDQARKAERSGAMLGELKEVVDVLSKAVGKK